MLHIVLRNCRLWRWFSLFLFLTSAFATAASPQAANDWAEFGWDSVSSGSPTISTRITAENVSSLVRHQVQLDGTVDASAIYLHGVSVKGAPADVLFVTTTYGKTIAVDASTSSVLWEYTPSGYDSWAGSRQITNSTPIADPDRQYIYAAAPDGTIQKLAISDGHVVWKTPITLLLSREKIASPLKEFRGRIVAVTGGYIGDQPPYQGHVVIVDAQSGKLLHVWNSLCSEQPGLIDPKSCKSTRSAIWGRAGAIIDPDTGNIFVATGNGPYNGKTDWGDSLIELNGDATQMLGDYTPKDNAELNETDEDLGSTSPVLLSGEVLAQGGKDSLIRLLSIKSIAGTAAHVDQELQQVSTPSGTRLFTAPAVWHKGVEIWMFAADTGGTAGWNFQSGKLVEMWKNRNAGTSPVAAGGLLYVYSPDGGLRVYEAVKGTQLAELQCGGGHWNSPIVIDGRIALPEGNANRHTTSGILDIWSLPGGR